MCPEPPAATTSTPPWRARDRARRSLLSRAAALQVPQLANPFVLLLFPHSDASERRRRPYPRRRAHPRRRPTIPDPIHPLQTPPKALPPPHEANRPLLVAQTPPEPPRRRASSSNSRRSPWTAFLQPFFRDPRAPKGSPRPPLRFPHPKPRRR